MPGPAGKVLVSLCICTGSSEPSVLGNKISTKTTCAAGSNMNLYREEDVIVIETFRPIC